MQHLKRLVLHSPVVLKLEEGDLPAEDRLTQYHIKWVELVLCTYMYGLFAGAPVKISIFSSTLS